MNDELNLTPTSNDFAFQATADSGKQWTIQARSWGDPDSASAAVLLVHGLGAHSGWFEAFASRLAARKLFVISYDQVGFGKRRAEKFKSRKQWLEDVDASFAQIKKMAPGKPVYLCGNSMGAVVAINQAEHLKPDAVALFSPGFDGHPKTFSLPYKLNALFTAFFAPDKDVVLPYTVYDITPSKSVHEWLLNDPDRRFTITARMGLELLKLTMDTQSLVKRVPCPIFMATAGIEKIVDNNVSNRAFERLEAPSKKHVQFGKSWHDLMFDPHIDDLVKELLAWLDSNVPVKSSANN